MVIFIKNMEVVPTFYKIVLHLHRKWDSKVTELLHLKPISISHHESTLTIILSDIQQWCGGKHHTSLLLKLSYYAA